MSESMIERVAKATCARRRGVACGASYFTPYYGEPHADLSCGCAKWNDYVADARAAIEAMPQPTPEMIEAGFRVLAASGISGDLLEADKLTVAEIYQAMIDKALEEGK